MRIKMRILEAALALCLFASVAVAQQQVPIVGGAVTIPAAPGNSYFSVVLNQNVTSFRITGTPPSVTVLFVQDSTGGRTVSGYASNISNTSAITIASAANATTAASFIYNSGANGWTASGGGGGGSGTPGGGDAAVQVNHPAGTFFGDATNFSYNSTTHQLTVTGGFSTGTPAPFSFAITGNASMTGNVSLIGPASQPAAGLLNLDGSGNMSTKPLQGTDTNVLTSGTVSGTASTLCTDASGGATTTGCNNSGAWTRIAQIVVATPAASETFSAIPGTFTNLVVTVYGRLSDSSTTANVGMQFNGDVAADYDEQFVTGNNTSASGFGAAAATSTYAGSLAGGTATANFAGQLTAMINSYASTSFFKIITGSSGFFGTAGTLSTYFYRGISGQWRSTAAITSITVLDQSGGNFATGTVLTLYGVQ